jgi:hypothetical protein
MESIFSRVEKKFLERVEAVEQNISWEEIKKKQKIQRKKECTNL